MYLFILFFQSVSESICIYDVKKTYIKVYITYILMITPEVSSYYNNSF